MIFFITNIAAYSEKPDQHNDVPFKPHRQVPNL